jgi:ABC-type transporter Mla maintaining outer membrane lipid asymmetry ATPase subunit MlaF
MLHEGRIVEAGSPSVIQSSTNPVVQRFIKGEPDNNVSEER